ncbi:hypothetical protein [Salibaculum halophilum]|uniref:hypothetical protein n=1 Tax=Salibaculum halophilum TaxID=1914408 RepID=UPI00117AE0E7|nr:hypothetical protein [Salibaculum halophilum]
MAALNRVAGLVFGSCLASGTAYAEICDYKPSKLAGQTVTSAAAAAGGSAAAAGAGLKAAGYYTLVHSASGLTMLGSTAAGASAAGTTGIIAGSAGFGATVASVVTAPVTIVAGAVTLVGVGAFEGACYFQVERINDPFQIKRILESVAINDPAISISDKNDGPELVLDFEDGTERYMIRDLYIADGNLKHRDWFFNTDLGPVAFVQPNADASAD